MMDDGQDIGQDFEGQINETGLGGEHVDLKVGRAVPATQKGGGSIGLLDKSGLEEMQNGLYTSVGSVALNKNEIKRWIDDNNTEAIRAYASQYSPIIRPLMENGLLILRTKKKSLIEKQLNKIRPKKEQMQNSQNELSRMVNLKVNEKSRLYNRVLDLQQQVNMYKECVEKTELQIIEVDKAIAAEIRGEDISQVVNGEYFPEKCYKMDLKGKKNTKARLQTIYAEANQKYHNLDNTAVHTCKRYKKVDDEIDCLRGEQASAGIMIDGLERLEDVYSTFILEMAERQKERLGLGEDIVKLSESIRNMSKNDGAILEGLVEGMAIPAYQGLGDDYEFKADVEDRTKSLDKLKELGKVHNASLESRAQAYFNEIIQ